MHKTEYWFEAVMKQGREGGRRALWGRLPYIKDHNASSGQAELARLIVKQVQRDVIRVILVTNYCQNKGFPGKFDPLHIS